MAAVDTHVAFGAEDRDCDVDVLRNARSQPRLAEDQRSARIPVLLAQFAGLSFHACGTRPALISAFSLHAFLYRGT